MKQNIALIGCGRWGKNHRKLLESRDDIKFSYICDTAMEEDRNSSPIIINNYHEALEDKLVDAVIIATQISKHYEIAKDSLNAGKHVLVEKPITDNSKDAEDLIKIAKENNKQLMVGHVFMYNPAIQYLKQKIDEGDLGEILYMNARRLSPGMLRERIRHYDVLWELGIHDLSMFLYLSGKDNKPTSINAFGDSLSNLSGNLDDISTLNIRFKKEPISCSLTTGWAYPKFVKELAVIGTKKTAIFDDTATNENKLTFYDFVIERGGNTSPNSYSPILKNISPLENQLNHFINCIKNNVMPISDGKNGLEVVKLLEYADESIKSKKEVLI